MLQGNALQIEIESLYKDTFEALYNYAFTIIKDASCAKDIVQEVFLKYYKIRLNAATISQPKAYLYKSVYHTSLDHLKKEHQSSELTANMHHPMEDVPSTLENQENERQIQFIIDEVINEMPPQCRAVFLKSRLESKKYAQIAAELNISIKTVEAHITKALKIIKSAMKSKSFDLTIFYTLLIIYA